MNILIVYNSQVKECGTDCGLDWSNKEVQDNAQRHIKHRFGDAVKLTITDPEHSEIEFGKGDTLNLPLLLIDGVLHISGPFDLRQLNDAVEAEQEMRK